MCPIPYMIVLLKRVICKMWIYYYYYYYYFPSETFIILYAPQVNLFIIMYKIKLFVPIHKVKDYNMLSKCLLSFIRGDGGFPFQFLIFLVSCAGTGKHTDRCTFQCLSLNIDYCILCQAYNSINIWLYIINVFACFILYFTIYIVCSTFQKFVFSKTI